MQVSIETTSGLERRMTVGIPAAQIDQEVTKRLQEAQKNVKLNGFRKGKVPFKILRQKFGGGVRQEVLGDTINRSLGEALDKENVRPAGQPKIEPKQLDEGQDVEYVATFEVYPEITLQEIEGVKITRYSTEITDADIDEMIETLRKSQAKFEQADKAAAEGDKANIDFKGTKDGEPFDGGSAEGYELALGSGSMIPGFEDGIIGMSAGEEKTLDLTFPEDYQVETLKGAAVQFAIKVNSVLEQVLPELDEDFFKNFGVEEGGLEQFRSDVKDNMEREKERIIKSRLKAEVLDALLEKNPVETPAALVSAEIDALRQQAMQQYGQAAGNLDLQSLLPDDLFAEKAKKRTALGLLVSEVVKAHNISVDQERLRALVESIAATYEDSESVVNYYYSNRELLAGAEAAVLEEQVVDVLVEKAQVEDKNTSYQELIKPANEAEQAQ